jgi:hypothetical protein
VRILWFLGLAGFVACSSASSSESSSSGQPLTGVGGSSDAASTATTGQATGNATSSGTATATSSSSQTSSSSSVASSGSGGAMCKDLSPAEPNQAESQAFKLKATPIGDCEGDGSITGVIKGASDVDWFTYQGTDGVCNVDPSRTLMPSDQGLRICKYLECLNGIANTEFTCPNGTTNDKSPDGRPGCCGAGGFKIGDLNCKNTIDEVAYVYIRIDRPGASAATCVNYNLVYHY